MEESAAQQKGVMYYDGTCPLCIALVDHVERSSLSKSFIAIDVHTGSLPKGVTKEEALRDVHVVDSAGTVYRGADGVVSIFSQYPRIGFLARVGRLPIVRQILQGVYRFVANNRYRIFGKVRTAEHKK